jgi:hypothetical protein
LPGDLSQRSGIVHHRQVKRGRLAQRTLDGRALACRFGARAGMRTMKNGGLGGGAICGIGVAMVVTESALTAIVSLMYLGCIPARRRSIRYLFLMCINELTVCHAYGDPVACKGAIDDRAFIRANRIDTGDLQ